MTQFEDSRSGEGKLWRRLAGAAGLATGLVALAGGLPGCGAETDSFLWDPSVVGRWERTPTSVPILRRITSIEGPADEYTEISEPTADDLIPEVDEYRVGPGDVLRITMFDIPVENNANELERLVNARGEVELPQIGRVRVSGLTLEEVKTAIADKARDIVAEPLVDVFVAGQRQLRYSVFGAVGQSGPFTIPEANYRLLDALTSAGGFSEASAEIFVIRQVALRDDVMGKSGDGDIPPSPVAPAPSGENLLDVIEDLSKPSDGAQPPPDAVRPAPEADAQPKEAPIELIEPGKETKEQPAPVAADPGLSWVYLDGKWVQVQRPAGAPESADQLGGAKDEPLMTQRVIRIPSRGLAAGDARYNVVIRPGDVIRVPPPPQGYIYIGGQVARPGVFTMADQFTLKRAITAAGGLGAIAIPERVDLTRMVGPDREATIRLNLRAIWEGTQPDVFLKANDQINIGTHFWATPMAIIRNGFRMTYGFGFLIDRNFGNDIFGPPPLDNTSVF